MTPTSVGDNASAASAIPASEIGAIGAGISETAEKTTLRYALQCIGIPKYA